MPHQTLSVTKYARGQGAGDCTSITDTDRHLFIKLLLIY